MKVLLLCNPRVKYDKVWKCDEWDVYSYTARWRNIPKIFQPGNRKYRPLHRYCDRKRVLIKWFLKSAAFTLLLLLLLLLCNSNNNYYEIHPALCLYVLNILTMVFYLSYFTSMILVILVFSFVEHLYEDGQNGRNM